MMDSILHTILNMSLTGAFVIAAISLARIPLRKAPKTISYCLWAVAGFRLVFPFSIKSAISLIPSISQPILQGNTTPGINRMEGVTTNVAQSIVNTTALSSTDPTQMWTTIGAIVWLVGVIIMIACGLASVCILKRNMSRATRIVANVYETENVETPFVLGFFPPSIYIPKGLAGHERKYVIMHENTHIMRRDHIVKFVAYFILCLHWFNPLAWLAFRQMSADMEMSCDEFVLRGMGKDTIKAYSQSLLNTATKQRHISGSLIAFGGRGVKKRVRNILRQRKYPRSIVIACVVLTSLLSVGLSVDGTADTALSQQHGHGSSTDSSYVTCALTGDELQHRRQPDQLLKLSVHEANTYSFGRILNSDLLPYGRYYKSMTAQGDELTFAYIILACQGDGSLDTLSESIP